MARLSRIEFKAAYKAVVRGAMERGGEVEAMAAMAELGRRSLFFLLVENLNRKDVDRDWLYGRCCEVQADPNGYLDLWAREHYKSTIITFGLTIQDILNDPEVTFGLFGCTRPIAKAFLKQIKEEFEQNQRLKDLYPEVLYQDPKNEAPTWSLDGGIVVRRQGNPKESTVEAWGLVDGQPTSKHFKVRLYDDIVTRESVTSPEMIKKVTAAWELSLNLGTEHGGIERYVGTRYHFNDTYKTIIDRKAAKVRLHPATDNGKMDGNPVLVSREYMEEKRNKMGPYTFGCQWLQDPKADEAQGFKEEWLRYWDNTKERDWSGFNLYLLVDPAGEKKKVNDYTVMALVGLGPDGNKYLIDMIRDRLNLTERTRAVFRLHRQYGPTETGYEKYSMQADIEHVKEEQERQNYRFDIKPVGGNMPKNDRIRRAIPDFEYGRWYLPARFTYIDHERKAHNITEEFIQEEFLAFPVCAHDDMLDCLSRIYDEDLGAVNPKPEEQMHMAADQGDYNPLGDWI